MQKITLFFVFFFFAIGLNAQVTLSFSPTIATVNEADGTVTATFVKTGVTSSTVQSYTITLVSGNSKDIGGFTSMNFSFGAGVDSIPFTLNLTNDSLIEGAENFNFIVRSNNALIGIDSVFTLTITDDEQPITIAWALLNDTMPEGTANPAIPIYTENHNATPVYYYIAIDTFSGIAILGTDYTINGSWFLADTGSVLGFINPLTIVNDTFAESYENIVLSIAADSIPGSVISVSQTNFWIANDDIFIPATINFINQFYYTAWEDTIGVLTIYVERNNPNPYEVEYRIEQDLVNSTVTVSDYVFYPDYFRAPPGLTYDTLFVRINNDNIVEPTEYLYIKIRKFSPNISVDSVFTIEVIDKDTVRIGFNGASYSFVEKDTTYAIPVITTSNVPYKVTAFVKVIASSAIADVDYICHDTILHFMANSLDTQYVNVHLLDDSNFEGNEQINILIDSLSPTDSALFGIRQFTFVIIENDENVGIENNAFDNISFYPNPTTGIVYIKNPANFCFTLYNVTGQKVGNWQMGTTQIDLRNLSNGLYLLQLSDGISQKSVRIQKDY